MKKNRLFIAGLIAGFIGIQATAFAEMIQGAIDSVDKGDSSLTLLRTDPATGSSEKLDITIAKNAKFKGVKSLDELEEGMQVRVEANPDPSGTLEAKKIETL